MGLGGLAWGTGSCPAATPAARKTASTAAGSTFDIHEQECLNERIATAPPDLLRICKVYRVSVDSRRQRRDAAEIAVGDKPPLRQPLA
jgi:hypothetical protein